MEKRTVLFVDDEENILTSLKRALMDEPYKSLFANSGPEALEMLQKNEVHVLVTDMQMFETSGDELLGIIKDKYPNIVRIALSGHIKTLLCAVSEQEVFRYITKSSEFVEELKSAVREALDYYNRHSKSDSLVKKLE